MVGNVGKLRFYGRFSFAVIAGTILGNAFAIIAASGIDASYGRDVTGGAWRFNLANVIYAALIGFLVGLFAGCLARTRGWLAGVIAQFLPLVLVIAISVYLNTDASSNSEFRAGRWIVWIGLLPAILGGHLGEKLVNDRETTQLLKSVGWHWSWVWAVLMVSLYSVAGSIRFLIADFVLGWQIIFIPHLWLTMIFALPVASGLLLGSFYIPAYGTVGILALLGERLNMGTEMAHPVLKAVLIALGIPAALFVIYDLNVHVLALFYGKGLWLP